MNDFTATNIEPKMKARDTRSHFNAFTITLLVFLILYTISLFTPLIWGLLRSFQKQSEFRLNIIGLPKKWVWNYSYVFKMFFVRVPSATGVKKIGMGMMFLYAFLYSLGCAFTSTLIPCITAYLCARYKFRFSKVVYTTVIVTMVLHIVGSLPSEIRMAKALGLFDKFYGLWLMKANFLGLYFLVFHGIFKTLPMAYTEAAKIDGAGNLAVLLRIILPLVRRRDHGVYRILERLSDPAHLYALVSHDRARYVLYGFDYGERLVHRADAYDGRYADAYPHTRAVSVLP